MSAQRATWSGNPYAFACIRRVFMQHVSVDTACADICTVFTLMPLESQATASGPSEAGSFIAGSTDQTIRIWDPKRGCNMPSDPSVLVQTLYRHGCTVTAVTSCSGYLISGGADGTVRLWGRASGRGMVPLDRQTLRLSRLVQGNHA
jgi:WD40 repeat protein